MTVPESGRIVLTREGPVARILIDRQPHLNALNEALRAELAAAVADVAADPEIRVVVLSGAGPKAFAAGADVEELAPLEPAEAEALSLRIADLHAAVAALPVPVVAAVRGWCLGGGLELALAADIRVASETARFGLPEIRLGILPGGGGIARLARAIGPAAAGHLCLTGAIVDARRALALGLVAEVFADEAFEAGVETLVGGLAASSRPALVAMKEALAIAPALPLDAAITSEAAVGAPLYGTAEQRTAMAAFLADRAARKARKRD